MFYIKGIDITNDKQMFNFLKNHFQYYTMNSWNRSKSIAHNVKIYNLGLSGDSWTALTFLQDDDYFVVNMMIEDWEAEHRGYKVGFNGRSGGYLVLYPDSGCHCVLSDDIDESENYEEYKRYCREYYGSVKANRRDLVETVKLVQDFDRLCDEIRDYVDDLSNRNFLIEAMKESVERFNEQYSEDLEYLGFDPLYVELDKVDISEINQVVSLYEAFIRVASKRDLGYRIERIGDYVYYVVD
jgi:hypothetical protein